MIVDILCIGLGFVFLAGGRFIPSEWRLRLARRRQANPALPRPIWLAKPVWFAMGAFFVSVGVLLVILGR